MSLPLCGDGAIILGTGVAPAAVVFAQETDDSEDTLLRRESRLCWVCRNRVEEEQSKKMRNAWCVKTNVWRPRELVLPVDGIWMGMCSHHSFPGWGDHPHCSVASDTGS